MGCDAAARMVCVVGATDEAQDEWRVGIGAGAADAVADEGDAGGVGPRPKQRSNDVTKRWLARRSCWPVEAASPVEGFHNKKNIFEMALTPVGLVCAVERARTQDAVIVRTWGAAVLRPYVTVPPQWEIRRIWCV
jgi:hypothetical protein